MEMEHRLAGASAVVRHDPEVGEAALLRDRRSAGRERAEKRLVVRRDVRQLRDVFLGDDEHVRRRLGGDVLEREEALVLVDLLGRNLPGDDPTEKAVRQAGSYVTRRTEAPRAFKFSSIRE